MSIFTGKNVTPDTLRFELEGIERRLMSIETILLEAERHRMGMTSDEDYKMWLRGRDQTIWALIMKRNDMMKEETYNG